jgi:hypothetical protein
MIPPASTLNTAWSVMLSKNSSRTVSFSTRSTKLSASGDLTNVVLRMMNPSTVLVRKVVSRVIEIVALAYAILSFFSPTYLQMHPPAWNWSRETLQMLGRPVCRLPATRATLLRLLFGQCNLSSGSAAVRAVISRISTEPEPRLRRGAAITAEPPARYPSLSKSRKRRRRNGASPKAFRQCA